MRLLLTFTFCVVALAGADADYLFGFVRTASGAPAITKEVQTKLQAAHMAHITSMAEGGALVAAGPARDGMNLRGIFIFKAGTNARELSDTDPYVKAGQLIVELHRWRGPAGIGDRYLAEHKANPGAPTKMIAVQLVLLKTGAAMEPALSRLRSSGKLMAAGPMEKGAAELGAIAVVQAGSVEAASDVLGNADATLITWTLADGVLPDPH